MSVWSAGEKNLFRLVEEKALLIPDDPKRLPLSVKKTENVTVKVTKIGVLTCWNELEGMRTIFR